MRQSLRVLFAALCAIGAVSLRAQDVVTVGSATATGSTVDVPVYVRDVSGTPLGVDKPAGSKIQSFSIKVNYSPASAVSSVTFARAGITANLTPTFESSPASAGAISWLANFPESTSPVPFTSNAPAPGNQVAHLVFTLSSSATAGSAIALNIDTSSLTQLNNQGGTTPENVSLGTLAVVNGTITLPQLSLSLSPASLRVDVNGSDQMQVRLASAAQSATTVNLTSADTTVATVPSSVTISAGATSANFSVSGLKIGSSTVTASAGSATATALVSVGGPTLSFAPAVNAIQIGSTATIEARITTKQPADAVVTLTSTDASVFTVPATVTIPAGQTSASFSATGVHAGSATLQGRLPSALGSGTSTASITVNDVCTPPCGQPQLSRIFAVVGSTPGSFGSFFKTSIQLTNRNTSPVSGKIIFHRAGTSGSSSDPAFAYSLQPGKTLSIPDLLPAMAQASGVGSADLVGDAGSALPLAIVRIFNDAGAAGTSGMTEPALSAGDAIKSGQEAALVVPSDATRFRFNIGVRTLADGASFTVNVLDRDGTPVKSVEKSYPATYFIQSVSSDFLDGLALAGDETLVIHMNGGSAVIYGTTNDNITNDPSLQFAHISE